MNARHDELELQALRARVAELERALSLAELPASLPPGADELGYRLRFERLILRTVSDLVELLPEEVDAGIRRALAAIGSFAGVDRAYVFGLREGGAVADNTHEWCAEGIGAQAARLQGLVLERDLPWFARRIRRFEPMIVERVSALPPEASLERAEFEAESIQSLVVVPMVHRGQLTGFLGFDSVRAEKRWSDDETTILKVVGATMTTALERCRAERALRESESHFRSLVENSSDIIFVVDGRGTFSYESPSASRLLGYAPGYLLGKNGFLFMHPEDMVKLREGFGRVLAREPGVTGQRQELRLRHADGSYLDFEGLAANLGARGVVLNLRDISERRRAEVERQALELKLQQTQKLESLGVLAGGIAHDFNNLLTGILGNADLAVSQLEHGPARESVRLIETAAQRAAELTKQLLAYSGKGQFVKRTVKVSETVEEMASLLEISVSKRSTLKLRFMPGVPPVEVDVAQLRQVVMNLITNASEAIGESGGVIALSTSVVSVGEDEVRSFEALIPPGRYVCVEVRDTGCGMTPEVRRRIFEPFFTTKFTGRGLGLAAVLGIVRGHGGTVRVESEPGQGTRFQILLPPASGEAQPEEEEPAAVDGAGRTILVVDDDDTVRAVARGILEGAGHTVLLARDGQEGVELFARHGAEVGLVLLDLTMPIMDGEETFRALRAIRPDLPVLLSSGYGEQETTERFVVGELAGFVQKPYTRVRLLSAVARVLQTSR
jgi:PAS domain S-box-containing protein